MGSILTEANLVYGDYNTPGDANSGWKNPNKASIRDLWSRLDRTGHVVQSVRASYALNADLSTVTPADDTIPQITEGTQILSVAITPASTTAIIRAQVIGQFSANGALTMVGAIHAGAAAIAAQGLYHPIANDLKTFSMVHEWSAATGVALTISFRVGPGTAGIIRANGTSAARLFGGVSRVWLIVQEIEGA